MGWISKVAVNLSLYCTVSVSWLMMLPTPVLWPLTAMTTALMYLLFVFSTHVPLQQRTLVMGISTVS